MDNNKIANHPDVSRAFADQFERTRKVGRIYLAHDEKVVDVLAATSYAPIWSCCSWEFWANFCGVCCRTFCFITTLCIKPNWQCKWNIHKENYTSVLVLTNRRLIRYKESDGSPSLRGPQRYSHQQIHLSAIGSSESHFAQALPGLFGRCMMLCGCCLSCHHMTRVASLKFQTKYPKIGITPDTGFQRMYAFSKLDCSDLGPLGFLNLFGVLGNLFRFIWKCFIFAIYAAFIQPGIALMEFLGIIKPSTETIIFEEYLSEFRDQDEHTDHANGPKDIKRYDAFLRNFNLFRSQYSDAHKIPPCNTDNFEVQQGQTWEDAYATPVCDLLGLGNRVFVNGHSTGMIPAENVIDAINVTTVATCIDWLKCCISCGCYFCGFIAPMRAFKQFFVFTTHRAMKCVSFSGNNTTGVFGTFNAYTRTVTSWYDCVPSKGAKFELNEALCCTMGRGCSCCSCCNTPINACMGIQTDFGVFQLDVVSKKEIYGKMQSIFSHLVKHFECKSPFTADKIGPHVSQHHNVSNRDAILTAECNSPILGGITLSDMLTPLTKDSESIHAGVYQYGDFHMSGDAGGGEGCFKKYICPDKFWWHSGMAVTEHKVLAYYNRCSSAQRNSNISITMIPADKIKASGFYHTAQSYSYQCCECCIKLKNLSGENPLDPAGNIESYAYGIMRAEIHVGTGSGTSINFAASPSPQATANSMAAKPIPFFGAEMTQHSAVKLNGDQLPELNAKEVELQRLYAVLSAVSYMANEKSVKHDISSIPALVPSYNSTPLAASGQ